MKIRRQEQRLSVDEQDLSLSLKTNSLKKPWTPSVILKWADKLFIVPVTFVMNADFILKKTRHFTRPPFNKHKTIPEMFPTKNNMCPSILPPKLRDLSKQLSR